jgi:hypothetical protein
MEGGCGVLTMMLGKVGVNVSRTLTDRANEGRPSLGVGLMILLPSVILDSRSQFLPSARKCYHDSVSISPDQ